MSVVVRGDAPPGHRTWLVHLRPTRPDWPAARTDAEAAALAEHFAQLERLTAAGECVIAGPRLDGSLGVAVYDGIDLDRMRALLAEDAMVVAGFFTAEVSAMRLSLERSHEPGGAAQRGEVSS